MIGGRRLGFVWVRVMGRRGREALEAMHRMAHLQMITKHHLLHWLVDVMCDDFFWH